ncbi:MAG: rod-binding protein [Deltaproteobacteria bacterium]|nr:rod-binding protein [Deltaproteobacteria bacterium]
MSDLSIRPPQSVIDKTATIKTTNQKAEQDEKLKKVCADFEAVMVYQLMKTMRQTIPKSGFLSGSHGKDTYEMMLDQHISESVAHRGDGLGLQKNLYNQLKAKYVK